MILKEYIKLIGDFVERRLPAADFERKYLGAYQNDVDVTDKRAQDILWQLFTEVDAYSPTCRPDEETPLEISEESLRRRAWGALGELQWLVKQDDGSVDLSALAPERNIGYGNWPLPSERDTEFAKLVEQLAGPPGTSQALSQLSIDQGRVLNAFAERMASLAVRQHSELDLRHGLLAWAIAVSRSSIDVRDALLVLPLLWRSAQIIGLNPKREFIAIGQVVGGSGGKQLMEFPNRSEQDQRIEVMGYVEGTDGEGFRYKRTW